MNTPEMWSIVELQAWSGIAISTLRREVIKHPEFPKPNMESARLKNRRWPKAEVIEFVMDRRGKWRKAA